MKAYIKNELAKGRNLQEIADSFANFLNEVQAEIDQTQTKENQKQAMIEITHAMENFIKNHPIKEIREQAGVFVDEVLGSDEQLKEAVEMLNTILEMEYKTFKSAEALVDRVRKPVEKMKTAGITLSADEVISDFLKNLGL